MFKRLVGLLVEIFVIMPTFLLITMVDVIFIFPIYVCRYIITGKTISDDEFLLLSNKFHRRFIWDYHSVQFQRTHLVPVNTD